MPPHATHHGVLQRSAEQHGRAGESPDGDGKGKQPSPSEATALPPGLTTPPCHALPCASYPAPRLALASQHGSGDDSSDDDHPTAAGRRGRKPSKGTSSPPPHGVALTVQEKNRSAQRRFRWGGEVGEGGGEAPRLVAAGPACVPGAGERITGGQGGQDTQSRRSQCATHLS